MSGTLAYGEDVGDGRVMEVGSITQIDGGSLACRQGIYGVPHFVA